MLLSVTRLDVNTQNFLYFGQRFVYFMVECCTLLKILFEQFSRRQNFLFLFRKFALVEIAV